MAQNFQRMRTKVQKKERAKKEKNSRSMQKRQAFSTRKAMRRAELGRQTEDRVEKLLTKKMEAGELISYQRYPPNSPEDSEGKDFGVTQEIGKEKITAPFGVTISLKSLQEHREKHPDVPCILIPPEMGDKRIWQRICRICEEQVNQTLA